MSRVVIDAEYSLEQYELLRGNAIRGHGLHLFLTRGMLAWIEAVSSLSDRQVEAIEPERSPPAFSSRPEVTTVLANMVLGCMKEAHA